MCMVVWIISLLIVMPNIIVGDTPVFDLRTYDCRLSYMDDTLRWLRPVLIGLFALVPNMIIVIVTTVLLLLIAKNSVSRSGKGLKWQGTVSTILVAVVYCISILPYVIYVFVGYLYSGADFVIDPRSFFRTHYDRITKSFVSINTVSNFYIYSMTVISFREFLWSSRLNVFKHCTSTTDDTTVQY